MDIFVADLPDRLDLDVGLHGIHHIVVHARLVEESGAPIDRNHSNRLSPERAFVILKIRNLVANVYLAMSVRINPRFAGGSATICCNWTGGSTSGWLRPGSGIDSPSLAMPSLLPHHYKPTNGHIDPRMVANGEHGPWIQLVRIGRLGQRFHMWNSKDLAIKSAARRRHRREIKLTRPRLKKDAACHL
jgi:hypothetical protein